MSMSDDHKSAVLFLCTGNSCRSQMAEGWLRHLASDRFDALSAGLEPRPVHPMAVEVMAAAGVDISGQHSKSVAEFLGRKTVRMAVFVCATAERDCPVVFPFALRCLSWPLEDPAAFQGTDAECRQKFAEIRDRIEEMIRTWLKSEESNSLQEKQNA